MCVQDGVKIEHDFSSCFHREDKNALLSVSKVCFEVSSEHKKYKNTVLEYSIFYVYQKLQRQN